MLWHWGIEATTYQACKSASDRIVIISAIGFEGSTRPTRPGKKISFKKRS